MPRPPAAKLHRELARAILGQLRDAAAGPGHPLSERDLAQRLGTSRSPVRGALQVLLDLGVAERRDSGRLVLRRLPPAGEAAVEADPEADGAERLYWRLAADRLGGALPDVIGEAELMRLYDQPRGVVHRVLLQILAEGWVERAPAGAWRFLPLIDGPASFDESYRFRRAVEPAALLDPAFSLPPAVLERLRHEQHDLARRGAAATPREVFEQNSGFHLALAQASNNRFLAEAILRHTHLRRVVGYVIAMDHSRLAAQLEEHLAILDRIEAGDRPGAAALLVRHLDAGRASKARLLEKARDLAPGLAEAGLPGLRPAPLPGPRGQAA